MNGQSPGYCCAVKWQYHGSKPQDASYMPSCSSTSHCNGLRVKGCWNGSRRITVLCSFYRRIPSLECFKSMAISLSRETPQRQLTTLVANRRQECNPFARQSHWLCRCRELYCCTYALIGQAVRPRRRLHSRNRTLSEWQLVPSLEKLWTHSMATTGPANYQLQTLLANHHHLWIGERIMNEWTGVQSLFCPGWSGVIASWLLPTL